MVERSPLRRRALWSLSLVALVACGHAQPEKDYGGTSGGGGPPPSGGKGGGNAAGSAGSAGSAGNAGGVVADGPFAVSDACKKLEATFNELYPKTLVCDVGNPSTPCTTQYRDRIVCGCESFITTVDFQTIAYLQTAVNQWNDANCANEVTCPEITCPSVVKGTCVANGNVGICASQ